MTGFDNLSEHSKRALAEFFRKIYHFETITKYGTASVTIKINRGEVVMVENSDKTPSCLNKIQDQTRIAEDEKPAIRKRYLVKVKRNG